MASVTRLCLVRPASKIAVTTLSGLASRSGTRAIHRSSAPCAKVATGYGTGPPPEPPKPPKLNADYGEAVARIERRKKQAALLQQAKDIRAITAATMNGAGGAGKEKTGLKKRFWREVSVHEVNGALEVHLDERPLRDPTTKDIIRLPTSKPALATSLAIEWDQLKSSQDATRQHLIPMTSLICRALDIAADDAAHPSSAPPIREAIVNTVLRYLDTDSLLCWAPEVDPSDPTSHASAINAEGYTLREVQEEAARRVVSYLTSSVWPGISITPVLDGHSIVPRPQAPGTREVVQGWIWGLSHWELAGLERATLAGKSLLAAARLVVEWSEEKAGEVMMPDGNELRKKFGVEEAARAVSVEVDWQTDNWGEVEDTHDVEHEDVRRQMGGVVLLVSGKKRST